MEHLSTLFGEAYTAKKSTVNELVNGNSYLQIHASRISLTALYAEDFFRGSARILEIGFSDIFHKIYLNQCVSWDYTSFRDPSKFPTPCARETLLQIGASSIQAKSIEYIVNLEDEPMPCASSTYNAVLCTEVIEHMACDPMFLMAELNRILKKNGKLILTTPNSTSARIFHKIASGYMPSFYMNYTRDRSLYKHNYEYCPHSIRSLIEAAGFTIRTLEAVDTFNEPVPSALEMLKAIGMSTDLRGDNLFILANKTNDGILNRYPDLVYS
jgi:hypothetical protein